MGWHGGRDVDTTDCSERGCGAGAGARLMGKDDREGIGCFVERQGRTATARGGQGAREAGAAISMASATAELGTGDALERDDCAVDAFRDSGSDLVPGREQ